VKADIDYRKKENKMKADNKKTYMATGITLIITGVAGLIFGNYILIGLPILGGLMAVAGFITLVAGKVKEGDPGPAEPVAAAKPVIVTNKALKPARLTGYRDHEGIYHGV
jgi:hypothetical protein